MGKNKIRLCRLKDLGQVKKVLQEHDRQLQQEKKYQHEAALKQHADKNLFRKAMNHVTPLKVVQRATHTNIKPQPLPIKMQQDEQNVLQESISDEFDVATLLDTDDTLSYRRPGIGLDVVQKLRRGHWVLQSQLDLHGYRRDEAREALGHFLREATRQGLRCVRIIHGKGNGSPGKTPILKSRVLSWLAQKNEVLAYTQARAADGGTGALIVLLNISQVS